MKFLAWFETNCLTRRNAYFCAGSGIAANARFPGPDAEDAESAELDAITAGQGLLKSFKDRVYGCLGFSPRQACPFDNVVHNILLDQCPCPSIEENLAPSRCGQRECPTGEMLLGVGSVVNLRVLQYHKQLRDSASLQVTRAREGMVRMSIQSDRWEGVISYGLSSYGYDLRVSDEFKIFTNVNSAIIDPKAFDERSFVSVQAESVIVPPNSFALARSVEYFRIPRDVISVCVGKSTYARCGIIVNVTPFEPEWEGYVTLEISNTTPLPARVYANEGLCQILFFRGSEPCEVSYADRKGKYQKQQGIVLPRL
jgi:dCTP deaminase